MDVSGVKWNIGFHFAILTTSVKSAILLVPVIVEIIQFNLIIN